MFNLTISDTPKLIKKGTLKMVHPVPVYVEITPSPHLVSTQVYFG